MLTRKHFDALADIVRESGTFNPADRAHETGVYEDHTHWFAKALAEFCKEDGNPRFRYDYFLEGCGLRAGVDFAPDKEDK